MRLISLRCLGSPISEIELLLHAKSFLNGVLVHNKTEGLVLHGQTYCNFQVCHLWGEIIYLDVFYGHTSKGFHKKQREGNYTLNNESWWMNECMHDWFHPKQMSFQTNVFSIQIRKTSIRLIWKLTWTIWYQGTIKLASYAFFFSYGNHFWSHAYKTQAWISGQAAMGLWETTCVWDVQGEGPLWQRLLQVCDGSFVEGVLVIDAFFSTLIFPGSADTMSLQLRSPDAASCSPV